MTIAVNSNPSNCEIARKKVFRGFNGIGTRGLCVSAAVPHQPEPWRPIHWEPANPLSSSTRERNETQNEMMWTAVIQMKWICDHRSESQSKQLRNSPKKSFRGFNGIRTRFIPFTGWWTQWIGRLSVYGSSWLGLVGHCSANAEATGSNPVEAPKNFFWGYFRQ